jgi:hypothetical protein
MSSRPLALDVERWALSVGRFPFLHRFATTQPAEQPRTNSRPVPLSACPWTAPNAFGVERFLFFK